MYKRLVLPLSPFTVLRASISKVSRAANELLFHRGDDPGFGAREDLPFVESTQRGPEVEQCGYDHGNMEDGVRLEESLYKSRVGEVSLGDVEGEEETTNAVEDSSDEPRPDGVVLHEVRLRKVGHLEKSRGTRKPNTHVCSHENHLLVPVVTIVISEEAGERAEEVNHA